MILSHCPSPAARFRAAGVFLLRSTAPEAPSNRTHATNDFVLAITLAVKELISIVVPTLREAANLPTLVEQIADALSGRSFEILVVDDDSRDGTDAVCMDLATRFPIRCFTRVDPVDGLGGAVLLGLREAKGDILVVMDADLQHPPSRLPALIEPIEQGRAEFAVGSRCITGGSTSGDWPMSRKLTSWVAKTLARPFASDLQDVMSGYFALPRRVLERGEHLAPLGFKIGLELICKCRVRQLVEVPIHFGVRTRGDSKLNTREKFRYLEHLSRLYDFTFPRVIPLIKFSIVVLLGALAAGAVYAVMVSSTQMSTLPHWEIVSASYLVAVLVTALFHARYVRTQRHWLIRPNAWRDFGVSAVVEMATCTAVAWYLHHRLAEPHAIELFAIPFGCAIVVRYVLRKELLLDVRGLRYMPPLPIRNRSI